jgi:hypothetical protein
VLLYLLGLAHDGPPPSSTWQNTQGCSAARQESCRSTVAHGMDDAPHVDGWSARRGSGSLLRPQAKRLDWIK